MIYDLLKGGSFDVHSSGRLDPKAWGVCVCVCVRVCTHVFLTWMIFTCFIGFFFFSFFFKAYAFIFRESVHPSGGGAEREGERESYTGSTPSAQSPMQGLDAQTMRS